MAQVNGNQFLPAELIKMSHYDKKSGEWRELKNKIDTKAKMNVNKAWLIH